MPLSVGTRIAPLTGQQTRIACLLAYGMRAERIAKLLGIKPRSAYAHSNMIRERIGVNTHIELMGWYHYQIERMAKNG